jgi:excisionase family DNA binding protein
MLKTHIPQTPQKLSITVAEAAHLTGFSENYVRLLMSRRRLPFVQVGRAVRLMVVDLERFLAEHRQGSRGALMTTETESPRGAGR